MLSSPCARTASLLSASLIVRVMSLQTVSSRRFGSLAFLFGRGTVPHVYLFLSVEAERWHLKVHVTGVKQTDLKLRSD